MAKLDDHSGFSTAWPGIAALLGAMLVAVGLLLPTMSDPAQALTPAQAEEYYEAATAVEQAAATRSKRNRNQQAPASAEEARELEAARARFAEARAEVEAAKESRHSLAYYLKIAGIVLVVVGAGGLVAQKSG